MGLQKCMEAWRVHGEEGLAIKQLSVAECAGSSDKERGSGQQGAAATPTP